MIIESIFGHARWAPDDMALTAGGRALSYRGLAVRITLARRFLEGQAVSRDRVAILCINSIPEGWIIGLALRSLGVTTVNARSASEVGGFGFGAITLVSLAAEAVAWPGLSAAADAAGAPLIVAPDDLYADEASQPAPDTAPVDARPGGHILLTSGTTGEYKKVLISTDAEARIAASNAELTGLSNTTVINVFDFGGWTAAGYFWPASAWCLGAGVVVQEGPEPWRSLGVADPARRLAAIVTPHLVARMIAAQPDAFSRNDAMTLFVVGGILSRDQWAGARERLTRDIRSIYGATETFLMTFTRLQSPDDLLWHRINTACEVQIVDDQGRLLPPGQVGAIRMRPTRVDGYLDASEATRAFFREGYFYPGDLGLIGEDGRLALRGRVTDVIHVLGDKFAALPIETALQEALGADAVCVFSAPGEAGEEMHVVIQPRRSISASELRAALQAAMPPGTANVQVHSVKEFPRNHMGKIERAVLTAMFAPGAEDGPAP